MLSQVILKPRREQNWLHGHPWIFSGAIAKRPQEHSPGAVVTVVASNGSELGVATYHPKQTIALRLLSRAPIDDYTEWFFKRLKLAKELRAHLPLEGTTAYRLCYGESDRLPGLVIDLYETTAVVEVNTRGMELLLPYLECALGRLGLSDSTIASGSVSARLEGVTVERCSNQPLLWAKENGFAIPVPLQSGQKTGWFCDQRDNRKHMGEWIRRLQVESVLNLFSYTGGFALYALAAGARHVVNVDRDANALSLGEEMVARNGFDANAVRSCRANVWEYLASSDETFDCVIVDPPAFVKEQSKKAQALEGYRKLLRASLRRVKEGGVLSLFSCSHFVTLEDLAWIVRQVSAESGHSLQTIARFGHSCDHSIPVWFMEAEYLKGLLLRKIGS